jgi:hypothetical protein
MDIENDKYLDKVDEKNHTGKFYFDNLFHI